MTHQQRIEWCRVCVNRRMDRQQGLICSLTGMRADFEDVCTAQVIDEKEKAELEQRRLAAEAEEPGHATDYRRNIRNGILFIALGLLVLIGSFIFPVLGQVMIVPYGAIAYGIAVLVRGVVQRKERS